MRRKSFLRYIQYKISQYTSSMAMPSSNGCSALPAMANASAPKWIRKEEIRKSGKQVRDQIRGDGIQADDDQRECPLPIALSFDDPVEGRQHQKTDSAAEECPARRPDAFHHRANSRHMQAASRQQCLQLRRSAIAGMELSGPRHAASGPAINPRIMVPSVGIKLSVR